MLQAVVSCFFLVLIETIGGKLSPQIQAFIPLFWVIALYYINLEMIKIVGSYYRVNIDVENHRLLGGLSVGVILIINVISVILIYRVANIYLNWGIV